MPSPDKIAQAILNAGEWVFLGFCVLGLCTCFGLVVGGTP